MRRIHRWVGLVSAVFMVFIAITGLALQLDLWLTGTPPPSIPKTTAAPPAPQPVPDDAALHASLQRVLDALRGPEALPAQQLTLRWDTAGVSVSAEGAGFGAAKLLIDAQGQVHRQAAAPAPHGYHMELQDLHAGYVLGTAGRVLSVVLALALLALGVTGLVIYTDLFQRRRKAGRHGWFWH